MGWRFKIGCAITLALALFLLPAPNRELLLELEAAKALTDHLDNHLPRDSPPETEEPVHIRLSARSLEFDGPERAVVGEALQRRVREWARSNSSERLKIEVCEERPDFRLIARFLPESRGLGWRVSLAATDPALDARAHSEGWGRFFEKLSLLPPFAAILTAVIFGKAILGLFTGAFLGAWLLATGALDRAESLLGGIAAILAALPQAMRLLFHDILLVHCLGDQFKLQILGFVFFLCATVGVMIRMGGIQGLVDLLSRRATTTRSAQLATYMMGLAIFFDDYANTIIVGSTVRPLTDRLRLAREKLAYVVDSTSAPVAGLAILSTWIAFEVSTFSSQLPEVGLDPDQGYSIFVASLPFRFYCLFTLVLVLFTIVLRREYGPMFKACRRALLTGELVRKEGRPMVAERFTRMSARPGAQARAANVLVPILILLGGTISGITLLGKGSVEALFQASALAFLVAALLALAQGLLSPREVVLAALSAIHALLFAFAILLLAWAIGAVCQRLGTAPFLVSSLSGVLAPELLPVALFTTACLVSFSTGSSWSTMAILLPNVVVLAWTLGQDTFLGAYGLLIISIGAVLDGSIFGDHCSPISDTTILSSVAAASDHMDHTRTQIPYALLSMTVAVLLGYLPISFLGRSFPIVLLSLSAGILALLGFLALVGRDPARGLNGPR